MFTNAIVRRPCRAIVHGITSSPELGKPDIELALKQHDDYIAALKQCGVKVTVLEPDEAYPDSCFVEDTAVLTRKCAIITNPCADSRKGEPLEMLPAIRRFYEEETIEYIKAPGTLEGGDVMMAGDHFYIGQSNRTNAEGIRQFISILNKFGMTGSAVPLSTVLHLKTGVSYIENNTVLVSGEFIDDTRFASFKRITVAPDEAYASNCVWINGTVIVPAGYPNVLNAVKTTGYKTIVVDTSEYRKVDGGLSCLSLRF
ncbi:MAG: N(G),N(G)-dimethylarginine dimethylaminohydrolase [Firmicutes bacterium ADurb.Bin182]|nr:MAG: N(G),N(G)-dimethylarginine dimethylaminohydrolase [Firmicutes bacterium ADurb.Bin182]